uniref:NADH-ubiquinone oxidoreductase chain 2 n=1 Tax=Ditaxis biseriata TaxID=560959 RepID=C8YXG9_DITBI|nr:NADH dehydrogenase subunit 2 [Ditaxis biseriata]ACO92603.1 NADH dehydrogenase subunit 2 [Ditaxis biseriata]
MFKSFSSLIFFNMLIMGTIISICSNSWLGAWMGLEINLLSFIPLLNNIKNSLSTESSLKYFLVQALASSILLFIIIIMSLLDSSLFFFNMKMYLYLILNMSLLMKMGAAPFHFWFPEMMEGLSWLMSLMLMTWQKIAPMILIMYCMINNFMMIIIILSIFFGSIGGLNQTSLRKLMAYSSINHVGWMIASSMISQMYWLIYFSLYSFMTTSIILFFHKMNVFYINQVFNMLNAYPIMKFMLFCNFLSLGGLPPFMGFIPKWMVIQNFMDNIPMLILMVMLTLLTLYYYLRITYSAFMINYTIQKFNMNYNLSFNFILLMNFISTFGLIMMMFIFYLL